MSNTDVSRRGFLQTATILAGATVVSPAAVITQSPNPQQTTQDTTGATLLKVPIQTPEVVEFQVREYLMKRVPPLPAAKTAADWTAQQKRLRKHLLDDVIFHGWPKDWVNAPPRFEDLGLIPAGKGYRLRKLRYEIVPGFSTPALLYEPENANSRAPATINLNGHAPNGKAAEYKQKRCINNALQGMYALSLEWLGMGEMAIPENNHWTGGHLNLVGASATGLFYLAIRKGVDYLSAHPQVDAKRIGVTGLSGGAWQSITIAALDERVAAAVPVAGYFSFTSAIERNSDVGDMEYHPHDLFVDGDYSTLTAMVAPRPLLLIYGATDEYGLRAPLQKLHLYDEVRPYYKLYGKDDNLRFYENVDPGTHNYQLDNRRQSYAFFTKHFHMPVVEREVPVDGEVKTQDQLVVGLPKDNLNILALAKKLAAATERPSPPKQAAARREWARSSRERLKDVVRYKPVALKHAWQEYSTRNKVVAAMAYRLQFNNGLSATAVWLKPAASEKTTRTTLLLDDGGMRAVTLQMLSDQFSGDSGDQSLASRIAHGEQVVAVNLVFTGDASPDHPKTEPVHVPAVYREILTKPKQMPGVINWLETRPPSAIYGLLLSASGDRPLGLQAAQLIATGNWVRAHGTSEAISVETVGIRNQVTGLVASALEPTQFSELSTREGMKSFNHLLEKFVRYQEAPDLFCLDLYKFVDIATLAELAEPTKVTQTFGA
jgi:dienelactone hydrolase